MSKEAATVSRTPIAAIGSAHAKLIVVGEHAAIYGYPALAAPLVALPTRCAAVPTRGALTVDSPLFTGRFSDAPPSLGGIRAAVQTMLARFGHPARGLALTLQSQVPVGRGLGSSAAAAASVLGAIATSFGATLDAAQMQELMGIAESFAHGVASGVDAAAATADGVIAFQMGKPVTDVPPGAPLHFVVADSGRPSQTKLAVEAVRTRLWSRVRDTSSRLELLGRLAEAARDAAQAGDLRAIGETMDAAQVELEALGVSDPALDHLIRAARVAGALGAKLTGAGRGGCIIALARDGTQGNEIARQLLAAGAEAAWHAGFAEEDRGA